MPGCRDRRLALASVTLATLVVVGSGTPSARAAEPERAPTRIKLVAAPYLTSAPFFVAQDLGLFAAEGLDVELVELQGPTASLPALAQGRVDVVGAAMLPAIFNLAGRGGRMRIVAGRAYESRDGCIANAVMVRKGMLAQGLLKSRASLRGMRLSSDRGGAAFFYLSTLLGSAGLTTDDVTMSDVGLVARSEALARNLLDVTMAFEPQVTQLLDAGTAEIWIPARDIAPDFQYTFLLFGSRLLDSDRDAGKRFLRAYLAGVERYIDDEKSPRLVEILSRHTKLDSGMLRRACWPATTRDGAIDTASLERYQVWALTQGLIDERQDAAKLIDATFLPGARHR